MATERRTRRAGGFPLAHGPERLHEPADVRTLAEAGRHQVGRTDLHAGATLHARSA